MSKAWRNAATGRFAGDVWSIRHMAAPQQPANTFKLLQNCRPCAADPPDFAAPEKPKGRPKERPFKLQMGVSLRSG